MIEGQCQQDLVLRERVLKVVSLSGRLSNRRIVRRAGSVRPVLSLPSSGRLLVIAVSMTLYPLLRPFPSGRFALKTFVS